MPRQLLRLRESRKSGTFDDQQTAAQISVSEATAEDHEDFLDALLSQVRQILGTANWHDPVPSTLAALTAAGILLKEPAKALADANQALSGVPTIDGVPLAVDARVLLVGQTQGVENGLWVVKAGPWERPEDFQPGTAAGSSMVVIQQGTAYADTLWLCKSDVGSDIVDTNPLTWGQIVGTGGTGAPPTGPASGDLDGAYPGPEVIAVHSGTTRLPIGTMIEGQFLRRFSNELVSSPTGVWIEELFFATAGQTVFSLFKAPVDVDSFRLSVNGVTYVEGEDFTLVGDVVTWLDIPFFLEAGDEVLAKYLDLLSLAAGSTELGLPTDGTYLDGLLPLTPSTTIADGIDEINEVLAGIVDPPPGGLDGTDLTLSIPSYSARLPTGLAAAWGPYTPGDVVSGVIFSASSLLSSPDPSTRFPAGLWTRTPLARRVYHEIDGTVVSSRLIQDGTGVTGTVEILTIAQYGGVWRKVTARISVAVTEGQTRHSMRVDEAGETNETPLYYDDVNDAPAFSVTPSHVVSIDLLRYLSGIAYYREGTVIDVSFTAAAGIFRKHYHATAVAQITIPGAPAVAVNPASVPAVGDDFPVVNESVTLVAGAVAELTPEATVLLQKADASTSQGVSLARGINTYATGASTDTRDDFLDELRRLVLGTASTWTSVSTLVAGNLQVRNGSLVHGSDGDYPGHASGSDADYERIFSVGVQSGGTVRLTGIAASSIAPYGTGALNIFLLLEGSGLWFDLGLDSPFVNGTGDGSSLANSIGARFGVSGGDLDFTLAAPVSGGPYSTGGPNSGQYRLRIRYRGATGLSLVAVETL